MPILITGMHRSGTSMITRLLNICGLYLGPPEGLVKPAPDNPDGYWEAAEIVEINENLIHHFSSDWRGPSPQYVAGFSNWPELAFLHSKALEALAPLRPQNQQHWGWKDPRTCLTLSYWLELVGLEDLKIIVCVRNPLNVIASLQARGHLEEASEGFQIWQAYYKGLTEQSKNLPVIYTHYDSFFFDTSAELERLCQWSGLKPSQSQLEEAKSFIKPSARHQRYTDWTLTSSDLPQDVIDYYSELTELTGEVFKRSLQVNYPIGRPVAASNAYQPLDQLNVFNSPSQPQSQDGPVTTEDDTQSQLVNKIKQVAIEPAATSSFSLISIIIPCYNQARFLSQAIESCLNQSNLGQDFQIEVIIIDDGSTDHLLEIKGNYQGQTQLHWYHQSNQGLPAARNRGLQLAKGLYIQFLDADDWLHPDKLKKQLDLLLHRPEFGMVFCNFYIVPQTGIPEEASLIDEHPFPLEDNLFKPLWLSNFLTPHSPLIRREWVETAGTFNTILRGCEDHEYWLRLSATGCSSLYIPDRLAYYRRHPLSMSTDKKMMQEESWVVRALIFSQFPELSAEATEAIFSHFSLIRHKEWQAKNIFTTHLEEELAIKEAHIVELENYNAKVEADLADKSNYLNFVPK